MQIRLGHATNSSSSHSIIFLPGIQGDCDENDNEFGWDYFTAADRGAKHNYVALLLRNALQNYVNPHTAEKMVEAITGANVAGGYIDHQSVYTLPVAWDRKGPDWDFFEALCDFFLQDDIVILGGNDNTDESHPLAVKGKHIELPLPKDYRCNLIVRHDPTYHFWTLYNSETGAKVRFSFEDLVRTFSKSSTPELVDLKITNFCPYNCAYCYQNSAIDGIHAKECDLSSIVYQLEKLKVFEVAIGGGEPTCHPGFVSFVKSLWYHGITPNFSTRNTNWFHVPQNRELLEKVGGFAISVDSFSDMQSAVNVIEQYNLETKATLQIIDRLTSTFVMKNAMRTASEHRIGVTILAPKLSGRGKAQKWNQGRWTDALMNVSPLPRISIDTALAREYQKELEELDVPKWMYCTREGEFSMYIDLVDMKTGRSSYEEETFRPLEKVDAELIKAAFAEF